MQDLVADSDFNVSRKGRPVDENKIDSGFLHFDKAAVEGMKPGRRIDFPAVERHHYRQRIPLFIAKQDNGAVYPGKRTFFRIQADREFDLFSRFEPDIRRFDGKEVIIDQGADPDRGFGDDFKRNGIIPGGIKDPSVGCERQFPVRQTGDGIILKRPGAGPEPGERDFPAG